MRAESQMHKNEVQQKSVHSQHTPTQDGIRCQDDYINTLQGQYQHTTLVIILSLVVILMASLLAAPVSLPLSLPLTVAGTSSSARPHSCSVSEPTEVDYVLALLESKQSHDRLKLQQDKQIRKLFADYAAEEQRAANNNNSNSNTSAGVNNGGGAAPSGAASSGPSACPSPALGPCSPSPRSLLSSASPECVLFSDHVIKQNRKHKSQSRVLLLSSRAVYNFELNNYKKPKRRILITQIASTTVSDEGDDFIIHVKNDYDYHYRSSRRADILHLLSLRYKQLTNHQLSISVTQQHQLSSVILTKSQLQQQQSHVTETPSHSIITTTLRALVSKKKIRYRNDGYDLDLTYITPRIIAMGFPSENVEGIYRNPYSEVYRLLEMKHHDHYAVYNLCSERTYDHSKFHQRVFAYPFDDHNAPSLYTMLTFCLHATQWLSCHPENIVAIHCKAGKGRTGVMIAALLLFNGVCSTSAQALDYFGHKRTHNSKGVTIPSQQRFVHYFEVLLRLYSSPNALLTYKWAGEQVRLTRILLQHYLTGTGGGAATSTGVTSGGGAAAGEEHGVFVVIENHQHQCIFDSRQPLHGLDGNASPASPSSPTASGSSSSAHSSVILPISVLVAGELKLFIYAGHATPAKKDTRLQHLTPTADDTQKHTEICHAWIHTSFLPTEGRCVLKKLELDKICKDKKHKKVSADLCVVLEYEMGVEQTDEGEEGEQQHSRYVNNQQSSKSDSWLDRRKADRAEEEKSLSPVVSPSGVSPLSLSLHQHTSLVQWQASDFIKRLHVLQHQFTQQEAELAKATNTVAELRAEISRSKHGTDSTSFSAIQETEKEEQHHALYGHVVEEEEEESEEED